MFENAALLLGESGAKRGIGFEERLGVGQVLQPLRPTTSRIRTGPELFSQQVGAAEDAQGDPSRSTDCARAIAPANAGSSVNWIGVSSGPIQFSE